MAFKLVFICAVVACAHAGVLPSPIATYSAAPALAYQAHAPAFAYSSHLPYSSPLSYSAPAITSQSANIYRSAGNLGQISTYSKTIDTPFSSVSKSDVRISNPGLRVAAAPGLAYAAAPALHAAPALAYAAAPALHAAPAAIGVAYSAAPAVSHITYDSGLVHYSF